MKKLTLLTLFILTQSALVYGSYEYTLLNFSNSTERTQSEILNETGLSTNDIAPFDCKHPERFDLFFNFQQVNTKADSLVIVDRKKNYIYKNQSLYNSRGRLVRKPKGFLRETFNALREMEKFPETATLVKNLQQSLFKTYILLGGNRYKPNTPEERNSYHMNHSMMAVNLDDLKPFVEKMPFHQIGNPGQVGWNPATKAKFMEADGVMRTVPKPVVLAHELMHAYDALRGMLDRRFVVSDELEQTTVAEFRAVYLENTFRKHLGGKYRRFYSHSDGAKKDLLDENDQPILLPTPCVKWL